MVRNRLIGRVFAAALLLGLLAVQSSAINVVIDYSRDTSNFFGAGNPSGANAGAQAKATLDSVASYFTAILNDTFSAIVKPADFHSAQFNGVATWNWTATFTNPATGATETLNNPAVAANEYRIYAGARSLSGSTAGIGGPGGFGWSSDPSGGFTQAEINQLDTITDTFSNQVEHREEPSGFASWGGSVTFDRDGSTSWFYNHTAAPSGNVTDFYSVAVHELTHAFGFGTSDEWNALVSGGLFLGSASVVAHGGPVPVTGDGHWANNTQSTVYGAATPQETVMDPDVLNGTRKFLTTLDAAALTDIGWDLVPPPAPSLTGDYNNNGVVDAADYVLWRDHLGQNFTLPNDTTAGMVTQADYDVWRAHFGASAGSGSGALLAGTQVPEPSTLVLLLFGIVTILPRQRLGRGI